MKSDIIYKIGTAEFRKRYIDPAIKSGKVSYDYKLRWGTQAFREKCMEIVLGEGSEESTTPIDASKISYSLREDTSLTLIPELSVIEDQGVLYTFEVDTEVPIIRSQGEQVLSSYAELIYITLKKGFFRSDVDKKVMLQVSWSLSTPYLKKNNEESRIIYQFTPNSDFDDESPMSESLEYIDTDLKEKFIEANAESLIITPIWWYNKDYDIEVPEGVETTKVTGNIRFVIMIDAASA
jgi:hypothetical protein